MKKLLAFFALVLVSLGLLLTSCEKKPEPSDGTSNLSGTSWKGSAMATTLTLTFNSSTTATAVFSGIFKGTINGTYVLEGEKLAYTMVSVDGGIAAWCEPGDVIDATYTGSEILFTITIGSTDETFTLKKQ